MPSVVVKLYSVLFKVLLKQKLQNPGQTATKDGNGTVLRPSVNSVPTTASFVDGVASKDINIDHFTSVSLRIFLPQSALPQEQITQPGKTGLFGFISRGGNGVDAAERESGVQRLEDNGGDQRWNLERRESKDFERNGGTDRTNRGGEARRNSYGGETRRGSYGGETRRVSYGGQTRGNGSGGDSFRDQRPDSRTYNEARETSNLLTEEGEALDERLDNESILQNGDSGTGEDRRHGSFGQYKGYLPAASAEAHKKLPIIVQYHGGGFVTGSKDSAANDLFCRRMAKLCDAIVVAVGYRLAPEHKYPAAFDDGFEALTWLAKQSNLAECNKSLGHVPAGFSRNGSDIHRPDLHRELVDSFGGSVVEPWLAAHGDPSRCVLVGVSSGGNIADHVARKAVQAGKLLEPVKVVAQVLMYPFFSGSIPTRSEVKLANSYFYDKGACMLAWKLFLPDGEYSQDHPAANPLLPGRKPPLKVMPPTLTVVAELDWMRDRAIAYSEALRKVNIDAPVLEYKDAVHEFATLDFLVKSRQAEACAEDMAIWIKKHISLKGHELSY